MIADFEIEDNKYSNFEHKVKIHIIFKYIVVLYKPLLKTILNERGNLELIRV